MSKRTIAQVFGRQHKMVNLDAPTVQWPDNKQLVGIEIEVESNIPGAVLPRNMLNWHRSTDGSLIHGVEYKLTVPLAGSRLSEAIYEFFNPSVKVFRSITSGTHIHINMDEDTTPAETLSALFALVYVIEPALFAVIDPGRKWSGFTNPIDSAPSHLLGSVLNFDPEVNQNTLINLCTVNSTYKYYGVNVQTLGSYGSLEFRYFPTATSASELVSWVSLVQNLKLAAMQHPTKEVMLTALCQEDTYTQLVCSYFSELSDRILAVVPPALARKRAKELMARADIHSMSSLPGASRTMGVISNPKYAKFFKKNKDRDFTAELSDLSECRIHILPVMADPAQARRAIQSLPLGTMVLCTNTGGDRIMLLVVPSASQNAEERGRKTTVSLGTAVGTGALFPRSWSLLTSSALLHVYRNRDRYSQGIANATAETSPEYSRAQFALDCHNVASFLQKVAELPVLQNAYSNLDFNARS